MRGRIEIQRQTQLWVRGYLGGAGLFVRPVKEAEEQLVGAGGENTPPEPGTPLYTF